MVDEHTQATTIPEGQYWPRVKMKMADEVILFDHPNILEMHVYGHNLF